jgi:integrase
LWSNRAETASRLRGRIEHVLDAAIAKGFRSDANPARWRGHLKLLLPLKKKLTRGHHAALAFEDMQGFIGRLRAIDGLGARALEFTILTAARSNEALGAHWSEFDLHEGIWTVPAVRMKKGRAHRVALSKRAVAVLEQLKLLRREDGFVFGGTEFGRPASSMIMAMQLRRLKVEATVHGFRSTFRDWVSDLTTFDPLVAEAALAHQVGDATERAYRRGEALEKRRKLMEAWADAIEPPRTAALAA